MAEKRLWPIAIGVGAVGVGGYLVYKYFIKKPFIPTIPGGVVGLRVVWKNIGSETIKPDFRYDLRKSGIATWIEGTWLDVPSLEPSGEAEFSIERSVPGDWTATMIDAKLVARIAGIFEGTVWSGEDVYKTGD